MSTYMDILEEWDDKISDQKNIQDKNLKPIEWIDPNINESDKTRIKNILEKSFHATTNFIYEIYQKFLVMFW